ncbi:histone-lysine N-methyltransferase 2D-like [Penaeus monodon]|uniref:histone-lysine N-methyltransferase 2D-like n=1 Tax=Penaeus monodon TaxID=6687 RepID=UPI0018A75BAC|nr:histone-lysine N-methyltransferase 2D-like [Penaeus monodon]
MDQDFADGNWKFRVPAGAFFPLAELPLLPLARGGNPPRQPPVAKKGLELLGLKPVPDGNSELGGSSHRPPRGSLRKRNFPFEPPNQGGQATQSQVFFVKQPQGKTHGPWGFARFPLITKKRSVPGFDALGDARVRGLVRGFCPRFPPGFLVPRIPPRSVLGFLLGLALSDSPRLPLRDSPGFALGFSPGLKTRGLLSGVPHSPLGTKIVYPPPGLPRGVLSVGPRALSSPVVLVSRPSVSPSKTLLGPYSSVSSSETSWALRPRSRPGKTLLGLLLGVLAPRSLSSEKPPGPPSRVSPASVSPRVSPGKNLLGPFPLGSSSVSSWEKTSPGPFLLGSPGSRLGKNLPRGPPPRPSPLGKPSSARPGLGLGSLSSVRPPVSPSVPALSETPGPRPPVRPRKTPRPRPRSRPGKPLGLAPLGFPPPRFVAWVRPPGLALRSALRKPPSVSPRSGSPGNLPASSWFSFPGFSLGKTLSWPPPPVSFLGKPLRLVPRGLPPGVFVLGLGPRFFPLGLSSETSSRFLGLPFGKPPPPSSSVFVPWETSRGSSSVSPFWALALGSHFGPPPRSRLGNPLGLVLGLSLGNLLGPLSSVSFLGNLSVRPGLAPGLPPGFLVPETPRGLFPSVWVPGNPLGPPRFFPSENPPGLALSVSPSVSPFGNPRSRPRFASETSSVSPSVSSSVSSSETLLGLPPWVSPFRKPPGASPSVSSPGSFPGPPWGPPRSRPGPSSWEKTSWVSPSSRVSSTGDLKPPDNGNPKKLDPEENLAPVHILDLGFSRCGGEPQNP